MLDKIQGLDVRFRGPTASLDDFESYKSDSADLVRIDDATAEGWAISQGDGATFPDVVADSAGELKEFKNTLESAERDISGLTTADISGDVSQKTLRKAADEIDGATQTVDINAEVAGFDPNSVDLSKFDPDRDDTFTVVSGGRPSISRLGSGSRQSILFETSDELTRFVQSLGKATKTPVIGGSETVVAEQMAAETRRELREQLDDTLEAEGYDPEAWNTDARADGTLILQDPETNKTKTIEPDSGESGIDSAVESLDSSSDSSTGDSDSTGGEQDSSPGGGADGLGQVGGIMLVAAIATAVYYGVTQL